MFNPDFHLDVPTGGDLLAEIGLDLRAISEVIEDDRSMRCPDRAAVFPERRFADPYPATPARARTSEETLFLVSLIMAPLSQELEPPPNPVRFSCRGWCGAGCTAP